MVNVIVQSGGTSGPRGNSVLSGTGVPTSAVGVDGDYYADVTNYPSSLVLYGPKAGGAWPGSGITLGGGGGGGAVTSVNNQTGAVTITAAGLGALLAANNLSDLASAVTARTNLGLGNSATRAVGSTAGTVAAGDDSRITGALQSGAAAGGDLSGTLPAPTVAKVNGVAVAGTPTVGQVPTATSGTAATWQALPVASTSATGTVQLAGDLAGTSTSPQVTGTHLAAPLPVAQGGTGQATAAAALNAYANVQGRNPLTGKWHPEAYGAVGDYATDDTTAVNTCIDACSAAGGGTVRILQHAVSGAGLHVRSNVVLEGIPGYSKLKQLTSNLVIASDGTSASNVAFRDFTIEGSVTEVPTAPKRTRATSGPGTTMGIWITGDLDPTATNPPVITNVTIERVTVQNCTSLPIRISGVRGTVLTSNCFFYNCQDAGWIFCENVRVIGCRSKWSADNGLSLSRGNLSVVCTGNSVEGAAYHGIWLSGYIGYTGPVDFECTGNTVRNVGQAGILLQDSPKNGVVTGNMIDKQWVRGDSTAPTDEYVYGIMIRGNSSTPGTPGTSVAYGLRIADNVIYAAPRAGISIDGATACIIEDNLVQDAGTQFFADGTTPITSSFTSQDIGILCSYPTTLTACTIRNNAIIDQRTTPYCNRGVFPVRISGALIYGNTFEGGRNSTALPAVLDAWTDGRCDDGQETLPRWAASNSGNITMSSGTLRLAYFTARRTATVTALRVNSGSTAAGATPTLVRAGLYSVDSSGNLTLMSAITSDTSLLAVALTTYSRNLAASQGVIAGQRYAIGLIVVTGATAPTVTGCLAATGGENSISPQLCATLTGQSDLPASITAGSVAQTQSFLYAVAVGA